MKPVWPELKTLRNIGSSSALLGAASLKLATIFRVWSVVSCSSALLGAASLKRGVANCLFNLWRKFFRPIGGGIIEAVALDGLAVLVFLCSSALLGAASLKPGRSPG